MGDDGRTSALLERIAMGMVAITTRSIAARGEELTFPQWRVLVVVGDRPEGVPLSEVAERSGATLSPMSRLVRRMQRRGWIELAKGDADRRVTLVRATDKGLGLRNAIWTERRVHLARVVATVGALTVAELAVLEQLADALSVFS